MVSFVACVFGHFLFFVVALNINSTALQVLILIVCFFCFCFFRFDFSYHLAFILARFCGVFCYFLGVPFEGRRGGLRGCWLGSFMRRYWGGFSGAFDDVLQPDKQ